jgi:nucleotide-binding universal stress UspA family protein
MIAKQLSATLSLVHVVDDDQPPHLIEAQINASCSMLDESARTIASFDGIPADARMVTGDAFSGILQAAEDVSADLIVVGPHRRQIRDVFVGTTAERIIAHSPRPVLMTAGVPSAPYDRALIAIDTDDSSRSAAQLIQETGLLGSAEIVAMHAFDAPAHGMMQRAMQDPAAIEHYVAGEERQASADFQTFLAKTGLRPRRQRLLRINGTAARTILESASEEDAALIVLGTSQKKGIGRFMLGSVAEAVLSDSDRDVLVVPKSDLPSTL